MVFLIVHVFKIESWGCRQRNADFLTVRFGMYTLKSSKSSYLSAERERKIVHTPTTSSNHHDDENIK